MEDDVVDARRWHVKAEAPTYRPRALDHFRDRYTVLLDLLRAEGLLRDPALGQDVRDWPGFAIRTSDLTEEGLALFRACHGRWNSAFGQARSQRHLVQWRRRLAGLRTLAGNRKLKVRPEEVTAERAVLLPEGAPIPNRLQRVDGRWRVDATPIIAGRKAAEAARKKATRPAGKKKGT
jgi:hypothetical protein